MTATPVYRPSWQVEKGDIFSAPGDMVVRVMRRSRTDDWVDVVVVQGEGPNLSVWSKRMPAGIPADWARLPRR